MTCSASSTTSRSPRSSSTMMPRWLTRSAGQGRPHAHGTTATSSSPRWYSPSSSSAQACFPGPIWASVVRSCRCSCQIPRTSRPCSPPTSSCSSSPSPCSSAAARVFTRERSHRSRAVLPTWTCSSRSARASRFSSHCGSRSCRSCVATGRVMNPWPSTTACRISRLAPCSSPSCSWERFSRRGPRAPRTRPSRRS